MTAASSAPVLPARPVHLPVLDGLRGLAVAIVLVSHLSNHGFFGPGLALRGTGKSGVYLFFVLSAFLLTRQLIAQPLGVLRQRDTWLDYALRRILRIWPMYLLVLITSWLVSAHWPGWHYQIDTQALLQHLTLQEGQSVLWSIPVEFKAYLWLPVIALSVVALRRCPAWCTALAFALAVAVAAWYWPSASMQGNDVSLGFYLPLFLCGAAAAWLDTHVKNGHPLAWGALGMAGLGAFALTTPLGLSWVLGRPLPVGVNAGHITSFGLLWACVVLGFIHAPPRIQQIFANVPTRRLGWISFSVYLIHMVVLQAWLTLGGVSGWAGALAVVALTLTVSTISWWLVERPCSRLRWPLAKRVKPRRSAG